MATYRRELKRIVFILLTIRQYLIRTYTFYLLCTYIIIIRYYQLSIIINATITYKNSHVIQITTSHL